jgi:hypothetical protein
VRYRESVAGWTPVKLSMWGGEPLGDGRDMRPELDDAQCIGGAVVIHESLEPLRLGQVLEGE